MNTFKTDLITVTSKKLGTFFKDLAVVTSKKHVKAGLHCSFIEGKARIAVKSARAIKKSEGNKYLSHLIHSHEYCSVKDNFDVILQQIQIDNFDSMILFNSFLLRCFLIDMYLYIL